MTILDSYIIYIRLLTFRMFLCSRLFFHSLLTKNRESDWYKRRQRKRKQRYIVTCVAAHIINLYGLASFSLLISWNITIYLVQKAKRKWSIRCSGWMRVISHFTNRHIFGRYLLITGTIALFRKNIIYTTRPPPHLHWNLIQTTQHNIEHIQ